MDDAHKIRESTKRLGRQQRLTLESLYESSQPIMIFNLDSTESQQTLSSLQTRGLIELREDQVLLTELGQAVCEAWQEQNDEESDSLSETNGEQKKESPRSTQLKQAKLEKSNQFLELYKQGLSFRDIGEQHELSKQRVHQILIDNPAFHEYLKERKEAAASAEQEKKERARQELYSRSLAALYPERVAELWDYEKNGDLKPEDVPARTSLQDVWFKCPIDGHSWKQKPKGITTSWTRSGTSGCPMCAGRKKKAEKQPALTEVYPELISQYWNYEKNNKLNLDPEKLTLGSNKKVWFKCPHDGNEWQASINSIIDQQWSEGNAGCRVCNGTAERKQGEWQRRDPIAVEFPEEVAKYWFYEANNELGLEPMKLTIGSSKEAFFKCPIDGHEWVASLTSIKISWKRGNSGCPACRGLVATETTSLLALYPEYVSQYWDYEKNNKLDIFPDKVTKGSQKEAWFKCPIDGYEYKSKITSIVRASWSVGNSGCARCGLGWTLEAIRQFVASLEVHIPNLTQAELWHRTS